MHLKEWAARENLTDREIAERMNEWLDRNAPGEAGVSTSAVQKYRTDQRRLWGPRLDAIFAVTDGQVDANGMAGLEPVGGHDA